MIGLLRRSKARGRAALRAGARAGAHGGAVAALALGASACQQPAIAASAEKHVEAPVADRIAQEKDGLQTAIFAGGCFWGVEGVFSHVKGVKSAVAGYHGGNRQTATYAQVSSGFTSHEEAVRVTYDPSQVRYDQLLQVFFAVVADPTRANGQGPDNGPQYNASIIAENAEQAAVAKAYIAQLGESGLWDKPIVTGVREAGEFYRAEEKHQDYMLKNPDSRYIQYWDAPKVKALASLFPDLYRGEYRAG